MRKVLGKIFLLCLACVLCTQGLCFAENWVQYGYNNRGVVPGTLLVDVDSVHTVDCKGRRFLQARSKEVFTGAYANAGTISIIAFDLENNLSLQIECRGAATGHLMVKHDISVLASGKVTTSSNGKKEIYDPANRMYVPVDVDNKMLQIIKQYRPDVVQAVLAHNGGSGQGNGAISGIPQFDLGGAVRIPIRTNPEFICTAWKNPFPEVGFEYGVNLARYDRGGEYWNCDALYFFDYDPETETFTFSIDTVDPYATGKYFYRVHVIDHNTVSVEYLTGNDEPVTDTMTPYSQETFTYRNLTATEKRVIEEGEQLASSTGFVSEHGPRVVRMFSQDGSTRDYVGGVIWTYGLTDIIAIEAAIALSESGEMPDYPADGSLFWEYADSIRSTNWQEDTGDDVSYKIIKAAR